MKSTIIIFKQPSKPLSLNAAYSMHWSKRRRYFQDWETQLKVSYSSFKEKVNLEGGPYDLEFTFTFPKNTRRDPHNYIATVKKLIDVLVSEGLVQDDTAEFISIKEPILRIDKDNLCIIKITPRDVK